MHMFNDEPIKIYHELIEYKKLAGFLFYIPEKVAVPRIYEIPDISPIKMFGSVE